jgi:sugar/nucleoside kinase (ribokinase family)
MTSAPLTDCPAIAIGSFFARERASERTGDGGFVGSVSHRLKTLGGRPTPIARLGMDPAGSALMEGLTRVGISTASLQTDPDLATGRLIERGASVRIEPYAAFDNLQWDADVEAAARSAELIVTDAFGRRHGQTRSTIDRLLIAAPTAIRVIDLTFRPPPTAPGATPQLDREQVGQALELCTAFIVDGAALRTLVPTATNAMDGARRLLASLSGPGRCVILGATAREEGLVVMREGAEPLPREGFGDDGTKGQVDAPPGELALLAGAAILFGHHPATIITQHRTRASGG